MNNFRFQSPTEFIFGKNTVGKVGQRIKNQGGTKVLLHYGGQSAIKSGLLAEVENSLKNEFIEYIKLGACSPILSMRWFIKELNYAGKSRSTLFWQ